MNDSNTLLVGLGRFLTGDTLDGIPRTDATWTHRGHLHYVVNGRLPRPWHYLARWERVGIVWAGITLVTGVALAYLVWPYTAFVALTHALGAGGFTVLAWAGYRATSWLLMRGHYNRWVWPLHDAVHRHLGYPDTVHPREYIRELPEDFHDGGPIEIQLPADYTGEDGKNTGEGKSDTIRAIVKKKLSLPSDSEVVFHLGGQNHYLNVVFPTPPPPNAVTFQMDFVRKLIEKAQESRPLIGLTGNNEPVYVDLDSDSPHILIQAGTGGGKSVTIRAIAAQLLHNGATASVIDRKRHSHKWIRGIPGVGYWRDDKEIHDGLVALGQEGLRRNTVVDEWDNEDSDPDVGPRHLLIIEEANSTIQRLKRYWTKVRSKEDPKESPAIEALGELLFMGRAVKIHILLVAQSATAQALGGPEMRENFYIKLMARYSINAFRMLAPEIQPTPKPSNHNGRWQVVLGGTALETQVLFFSEDHRSGKGEARDWALSGTRPRHSVTDSAKSLPQGERAVIVTGRHLHTVAPTEAPAEEQKAAGISLREAVETGVVEMPESDTTERKLAALRQASARDVEFPEHVGKDGNAKKFDPDALREWERNRLVAVGGKSA